MEGNYRDEREREGEIKNYLELNENLFDSVGHRKSSSHRYFILMSSDT
jgi:hypothetical protein